MLGTRPISVTLGRSGTTNLRLLGVRRLCLTELGLLNTSSAQACLSLKGHLGNLDIFVVYASHDCVLDRRKTCLMLAAHTKPRSSCLTLVMGDFNYVEQHHDCFNFEATPTSRKLHSWKETCGLFKL